ncbi:sulfite exporter TauE/SafE family protein [Roseospirillum parvum]|uniref:Urease accessory protein UreH-like transmembrane domain-containing protein n=1 Tax=Roseospirillum parvum TaxID=83401 RepID=A0A1G7WV53_9PROT|nr:sulfite exporter TauE/SafE family protein [Roseospirillum parvum]SDG75813.1 hypothetical protein SAMN05421742_102330 [Roseospirillum parvum]
MDPDPLLLRLLDAGLSHCRVVVDAHGSLLASLFMAGLLGGLTHCTGMCGPFVLSQVAARLEEVPASRMREWHRLAGASLIPYHLGRLTTYVGLGVAAALVAGAALRLPGLSWLSAALLGLAALLFIGFALPRLKALPGLDLPVLRRLENRLSDSLGRVARPLFASPTGGRGYLLGVVLGFLPCGLLYGALAAAAAPGDPLTGALAMGAFAVGTVPALFGVGLIGHLAGGAFKSLTAQVAPLLLLLNAGVLGYMAITLI